jgi:hypothetical protein
MKRMSMKELFNEQDLRSSLQQFTGTAIYIRHSKFVVLTEGALFLAEQARCYWLYDLFSSHLIPLNNKEEFACLKLVKVNDSANITIDNGCSRMLAKQHIEYTDFPLDNLALYGCWANHHWVLMLPTEY